MIKNFPATNGSARRYAAADVPSLSPTPEQGDIIEAFCDHMPLIIEARAGTGKTATLSLCAQAAPDRRALYVAYNRSSADNARRRFPKNVQVETFHSYALGQLRKMGIDYGPRLSSGNRLQSALEISRILRISPYRDNTWNLSQIQMTRVVMAMVKSFAISPDPEVYPSHLTNLQDIGIYPVATTYSSRRGIISVATDHDIRRLANAAVGYARDAWADITSDDGQLRFKHDYYLKLFAMSSQFPKFTHDVVLLDEAQDTNPVMASLLNQMDNTQLVVVGDPAQGINEWNGAVDAMSQMRADKDNVVVLPLSQSWRFGSEISNLANRYLEHLSTTDVAITGHPNIKSQVGEVDGSLPYTVLCRTNSAVMEEAIVAISQERKVHVVGGVDQLINFARGASALKRGERTSVPELTAFYDWGQVQEYVALDPNGDDLRMMVQIIDDYSPEVIINALSDKAHQASSSTAHITVSTVHKAKGLEWDQVVIGRDFNPIEVYDSKPETLRLRYVAVTRSKNTLQPNGLAFDQFITPDNVVQASLAY